jgi:hypothetical protein
VVAAATVRLLAIDECEPSLVGLLLVRGVLVVGAVAIVYELVDVTCPRFSGRRGSW